MHGGGLRRGLDGDAGGWDTRAVAGVRRNRIPGGCWGAAVAAALAMLAGAAPAAGAATATLLKDINPGPEHGICCGVPFQPTVVAGTLLFGAYDQQRGGELWKSDGTAAGTVLVADTSRGAQYVDGTYPVDLAAVGSTVFFDGSDPVHGAELWKSDGTASGTTLVKDINTTPSYPNDTPDSRPSQLIGVGDQLFFVADDGVHDQVLWRSDGTAAGTRLLKEVYPRGHMIGYRGELFFSAFDYTHGAELWKSDGTAAGTELVKDIYPGSKGSYPYPHGSEPRGFIKLAGTLYFSAGDAAHGRELWKTDGTAAGTKLVADIYRGRHSSHPDQFAEHAGTLYFDAQNRNGDKELWRSSGRAAGTRMVKDIKPGPEGSRPGGLTSVGPRLFFVADDGTHGYEVWKSDGTRAGTRLLKDIVPGEGHPYLDWFTGVGSTLFFGADDHTHGEELWSSNGTTAGTQLVRDIYPGRQRSGGYPTGLREFQGAVFFWADDPSHGVELWKAVP
jgi:ELWxxDGT repeat protein